MKRLRQYRTLKCVCEKYNIDPQKLQTMVTKGSIKAILCNDTLAVSEDDVRAYIADRDINRSQFAHLKGPITLSEAAQKYRFNTGSLWRWIGKGEIQILEQDGYRVFVNEADVAYARALADMKGLRSGQSLF